MTTFPHVVTARVAQYRGRRHVTTQPPLPEQQAQRLGDGAAAVAIKDQELHDFGTFSLEALFVDSQIIACESRLKEMQ